MKEPPAGRDVFLSNKEVPMHKDQIEGAGKQAKGAIKDAAGKLSGDVKLQAEGKLDKAAGQIQSAVGKVKDDARKELKH
jgi:uncharacterized protein YjbJ (UPF0337 family)